MKFKYGDRVNHRKGYSGTVKHTSNIGVYVHWDNEVPCHFEGEKEIIMETESFAKEEDLSFQMKFDPEWASIWDDSSS